MLQFSRVDSGVMMTAFGTYIRAKLKSRAWNQQSLAIAAEIPASTLSALMTGQNKEAELSTLVKIANALEVDLGEVLEVCGYPVTRSISSEVRDRRLAIVLDSAPWMRPLAETIAELPEGDQDSVVSFVEHLAQRRRSQKS